MSLWRSDPYNITEASLRFCPSGGLTAANFRRDCGEFCARFGGGGDVSVCGVRPPHRLRPLFCDRLLGAGGTDVNPTLETEGVRVSRACG